MAQAKGIGSVNHLVEDLPARLVRGFVQRHAHHPELADLSQQATCTFVYSLMSRTPPMTFGEGNSYVGRMCFNHDFQYSFSNIVKDVSVRCIAVSSSSFPFSLSLADMESHQRWVKEDYISREEDADVDGRLAGGSRGAESSDLTSSPMCSLGILPGGSSPMPFGNPGHWSLLAWRCRACEIQANCLSQCSHCAWADFCVPIGASLLNSFETAACGRPAARMEAMLEERWKDSMITDCGVSGKKC